VTNLLSCALEAHLLTYLNVGSGCQIRFGTGMYSWSALVTVLRYIRMYWNAKNKGEKQKEGKQERSGFKVANDSYVSLLLLSLTSSSLIPSHAPTLIHLLTTLTGAPAGKRMIIFVDDLNMPKLDTYGSQPPIELLRQYQDFAGLYDREKLFWKEIHVSFLFACHSFHLDPVSVVSFLVLCAGCQSPSRFN